MTISALWNSKKIFVFLDQFDIYFQFYDGDVLQMQHHTQTTLDGDSTIQGFLAAHPSDLLHIFLHTDGQQFSHAQIAHFSLWEYVKLRYQLWRQQKTAIPDESTQVHGQCINRKNMATVTMKLSAFQNCWLKDMAMIPNPVVIGRHWIGDVAAYTFFKTHSHAPHLYTENAWHIICAQLPHSPPLFIVCQGQNILFTRPYQQGDFDQEQKATALYLRRFGYKTTDMLTIHHKKSPLTLEILPQLRKSFTLHNPIIGQHQKHFLGQKFVLILGPLVALFCLTLSTIAWIKGHHIQTETAVLREKIALFPPKVMGNDINKAETDRLGAIIRHQNEALPIMPIIHFLQEKLPAAIVVIGIKWSLTQIQFELVMDPTRPDAKAQWPEILEQLQQQFPGLHPETNQDDTRLTLSKISPKIPQEDKTEIKKSCYSPALSANAPDNVRNATHLNLKNRRDVAGNMLISISKSMSRSMSTGSKDLATPLSIRWGVTKS